MNRGKSADLIHYSLENQFRGFFRIYHEVTIHSKPSFTPCGFPHSRRLDVVMMERQRSKGGTSFKQFGYEVKSCMSDLTSDKKMHYYIDRVDYMRVIMLEQKDAAKILDHIPEQFGLTFMTIRKIESPDDSYYPIFNEIKAPQKMIMTNESRFSLLYGMCCSNEKQYAERERDCKHMKELLVEAYQEYPE